MESEAALGAPKPIPHPRGIPGKVRAATRVGSARKEGQVWVERFQFGHRGAEEPDPSPDRTRGASDAEGGIRTKEFRRERARRWHGGQLGPPCPPTPPGRDIPGRESQGFPATLDRAWNNLE